MQFSSSVYCTCASLNIHPPKKIPSLTYLPEGVTKMQETRKISKQMALDKQSALGHMCIIRPGLLVWASSSFWPMIAVIFRQD